MPRPPQQPRTIDPEELIGLLRRLDELRASADETSSSVRELEAELLQLLTRAGITHTRLGEYMQVSRQTVANRRRGKGR